MSKIVIDTNILYSYVGFSENTKVKNDELCKFTLATTTATLVEVIVKNRGDLDAIKMCIRPIYESKIELISIGHMPLSNEIIGRIMTANRMEDAMADIDNVLKLKIKREAEFLRWIFIISILGIFEVLRSNQYGFSDQESSNKQLFMIRSLIVANEGLLLEYFVENITEGYEQENEQVVTFNAFNEMLLMLLNIFNFNYHQIKTGIVIIGDSDKTDLLNVSLSGDNFAAKIKKDLPNLMGIASKKSSKNLIERYLSQISSGIVDSVSLTDESIGYLIHRIESCYITGSKIKKNDIFDFFIVFALGIPDSKILTLDKNFAKVLEKISPDSFGLCQQLGYVK